MQRNFLERTEGPEPTCPGLPRFLCESCKDDHLCHQRAGAARLCTVSPPEAQRSMSQPSALMLASSQDLNIQ